MTEYICKGTGASSAWTIKHTKKEAEGQLQLFPDLLRISRQSRPAPPQILEDEPAQCGTCCWPVNDKGAHLNRAQGKRCGVPPRSSTNNEERAAAKWRDRLQKARERPERLERAGFFTRRR